MKYIKKFESTVKDRVNAFNDLKYNIECLLMDIIDEGFQLEVRSGRRGPRGNISIKLSTTAKGFQGYEPNKRFNPHIVDYLLSLIDYMKTIDYSYNSLKVVVGHGYRETTCKIEDGRIKSYPLKNDRYIAEYLIRTIIIEFNDPIRSIR